MTWDIFITRFASLVLFVVFLWAGMASAQLEIDDCHHFEWDCVGCTDVGAFRIYASQTSGVYAFVRRADGTMDPRQNYPTLTIPVLETMVTQALCTDLAMMLTTGGTWFAVVTLVTSDWSAESDPSNEVQFTFRNQTSLPPTGLPPRPPPPPPAPLPKAPPLRPPVSIPPVVRRDNAPFTQTEMFQGTGRTLPPTRKPIPVPKPCQDAPGAKFTDSCMFRGQP